MLVMMTTATAARLAVCERRYRNLAQKIAEIGWVASGSVAQRFERCGKTNCACYSDPTRRHGPYWHFTAKVGGKTVNKRLSEKEAHLYEEWIRNDRTVHSLLAEMRAIAAEAQVLILAEEVPGAEGRKPRGASPEMRRAGTRRSG
jgi:hypothetical protein